MFAFLMEGFASPAVMPAAATAIKVCVVGGVVVVVVVVVVAGVLLL